MPIKFKKICFSRWVSVAPSWWCHSHFWGVKLKLRSRAFRWCIVCFCNSNGYLRILKRARGFFLQFSSFLGNCRNNLFQKLSSSLFQYSESTIASTEINNTSAESMGSQLFGTRRTRAWHGQEGATPTCRKRHWKKSKFNGAKSGRNFFFFDLIFNIFMLWAKCMPIDFEFQQGLFYILTNCQT